jgi:hypothetical protein
MKPLNFPGSDSDAHVLRDRFVDGLKHLPFPQLDHLSGEESMMID